MSEPDELPEHLLAKLRISIPGYELLDKIKAGGQGTVYRAREMTSDLTVAIKLLHGGPLADESSRRRLLRETATLRALNHPNIVCAIESGRTPVGLDYLVMNYVEGRPLDDVWTDAAFAAAIAPEPPARLRLFKKICDVVQTAHLKGITHRDLSPSNILIDPKGEPHLLDFGLASTAFNKILNPAGTSLSLNCQFLGKLQYAAPDQVKGGRDAVDIRTDVYALGVILYQILTNGILPYEVGDNLADAIKNIVHTRPLPPSSILAAHRIRVSRGILKKGSALVNPTIEAIVLKALEKEKAARYQSAGELAADIDHYLAGRPTVAQVRRDPTPTAARWKRLALAALFLVLLLAAGIWGWPRLTRRVSVARSENSPRATLPASTVPAAIKFQKVQTKEPPVSGNPLVDLMPLIDLDQDVIRGHGHWTKSNAGLAYDGQGSFGGSTAAVRAGYEPPVEYDYRIAFTTSRKEGALHLLLSQDGRPFDIAFDDGDCKVWFWDDPDALASRQVIEPGVPHRALVQVRRDKIAVYLDDKRVAQCGTVKWRSAPWNWLYVGERAAGIYVFNEAAITFTAIQVLEVNGTGRRAREMTLGEPPSLGMPPPGDKPLRVVNLMPLIQPGVDAVDGTWVIDGKELFKKESGANGRLVVPYEPPEEYDLRVEFTRQGYGPVALMLPRGHRGFSYLMGASANTACGFAAIKGCAIDTDPARVKAPAILLDGKRYSAVVYVRKDFIAASIDGKLISKYKTEGSDLSMPDDWVVTPGVFGVGSPWTVTFHKIEIAEISGQGKPIRKQDNLGAPLTP